VGDKHSYTAIALLNLGRALTSLARYDEAQAALDEAWSIYEALFGAEHQHAVRVLSARAELELVRGRYASAERQLRRVVELSHRVFGPKHRETAANFNLLGITLRELGRLDEAVDLQRQALAIRVASLGADHPDNAPVDRALALTYISRNELPAAEAALREAMRIEAKADVADMLPAALTRGVQGWLLHLQGNDAAALEALNAAVTFQRGALGDLHPDVGRTLVHLGEIECANGLTSPGREHLGLGVKALQPLVDPRLAQAIKALNQCTLPVASR
ncbi:MAG: tetratricopeptide repeat protein, partial [Burkholderiales bacterium]